jgi:hypothetical protein
MTPYEDEYQREEFEKQDVLTQVTLMAGSAIQSAYDSATKKVHLARDMDLTIKHKQAKTLLLHLKWRLI